MFLLAKSRYVNSMKKLFHFTSVQPYHRPAWSSTVAAQKRVPVIVAFEPLYGVDMKILPSA